MPNRPYLYHELTTSICSVCYRKVEAKIIEEDGRMYMVKRCLLHGPEKVLISTDVPYYKRRGSLSSLRKCPFSGIHRLNTAARMTAASARTMSSTAV